MFEKMVFVLLLLIIPFVLFAKKTKETKIPDGMVLIPAGEFWMGSDDEEIATACDVNKKAGYQCDATWFAGEKPKHRVYLDAYIIDKYPVTNARYKKCASSGECKKPLFTTWYDNSTYANYPVVYVNWKQSNVYCKWAGKRLPTEAEWEKSARGEQGNVYLWGNAWSENKCNTFTYKMLLQVQTASMEQIMHKISNPNKGTTPVGSFKDCISSYGVYDMAGNVWEWVSDWYYAGYYKNPSENNPKGPTNGELRVTRGGAWGMPTSVSFRASFRHRNYPSSVQDNLGFRCAKSAE